MAYLQKTPSGDTLAKTKKLATTLESNPRLRRAMAAVIRAIRDRAESLAG